MQPMPTWNFLCRWNSPKNLRAWKNPGWSKMLRFFHENDRFKGFGRLSLPSPLSGEAASELSQPMAADDTHTHRVNSDDFATQAGLAKGRRVLGRYVYESIAGKGGMGAGGPTLLGFQEVCSMYLTRAS
jgi:hypothetical protein